MKQRDIVIGIVVIALLGGIFYYRQKNQAVEETKVPQTLSTEKDFEDKFKFNIPDDADKVDLTDTSGGNSSGIASKKFSNGKFEASVLADLPELKSGEFYQAWIVKDGKPLSMGKMISAKGGWMIEFESSTDYSDYNQFMVTREKKFDTTQETKVLEGNL